MSVSADKVLNSIQLRGRAAGGLEQEYVDNTVAVIMAGMRTLDSIYKHRNLNFDENEKLRLAALDNAKENLEFGKKAADFIKSLPAMTVTTGVGITIGIEALGLEPLQLWMLGIGLAGASYWVNLFVVRRWYRNKQKLYMKQDYERQLYYEQYIKRVSTTLTSMYSAINQVHKRVFKNEYPGHDLQTVDEILEGTKYTWCKHIDLHMKEDKITPMIWPLCETGRVDTKAAEECDLLKKGDRLGIFRVILPRR